MATFWFYACQHNNLISSDVDTLKEVVKPTNIEHLPLYWKSEDLDLPCILSEVLCLKSFISKNSERQVIIPARKYLVNLPRSLKHPQYVKKAKPVLTNEKMAKNYQNVPWEPWLCA